MIIYSAYTEQSQETSMFFQTELKTVSVVKRIKLLNLSKCRSQSINMFFPLIKYIMLR